MKIKVKPDVISTKTTTVGNMKKSDQRCSCHCQPNTGYVTEYGWKDKLWREIFGRHSTLWNYSKEETLEKTKDFISKLLAKQRQEDAAAHTAFINSFGSMMRREMIKEVYSEWCKGRDSFKFYINNKIDNQMLMDILEKK